MYLLGLGVMCDSVIMSCVSCRMCEVDSGKV